MAAVMVVGTVIAALTVTRTSYRVVERGSYSWTIGWQVEVRNTASSRRCAFIQVELLDADGFPIREDPEAAFVRSGIDTVRATTLVRSAQASEIRSMRAAAEEADDSLCD